MEMSRYFPKFVLNSVAVTTIAKFTFISIHFLLYTILEVESIKSFDIREIVVIIHES